MELAKAVHEMVEKGRICQIIITRDVRIVPDIIVAVN